MIAVLWTWLAGQRQALGALAVTCHQIRDQVRRSTQIEGRTLEQSTRDEIQCLLMELPGLELEEAVAAAARTLATLGRSAELTRVPTWMSG
ncbi:MAG: hypothetical protein ACREQ5_19985, partial [Candidatus Dormibacteria bacterium]